MKCAKCQDELPLNGECVVCGVCGESFHHDCSVRETKWRNWSVEQKGKWCCVPCKGSGQASRANSAAGSQHEGDTASSIEEDSSIKAILQQINTRLSTLDAVKMSVQGIETSLTFLSERYDELMEDVKKNREVTKQLETEVGELKLACSRKDEELSLLTKRFNALEQYGRGHNLEIHGLDDSQVPESSEWVLQHVAKALGLTYHPSEIQAAHRVPSRNRQRPEMFLVQFTSKAVRERWLRAGKRTRLYSRDIVGGGDFRVYFNENLTPFFSRLLMEAKKRAKEKNYQSVWVMNGRIRVKKSDEARQILTIASYEDLKLIV